MAYDPFKQWDVSDPYGASPQQRLARSLAGSAYESKGLKRDYQTDRYDLTKAYKKQVPQMLSNYAQRGMETSGVKNLGMAEMAAAAQRQMTERANLLDQALMNIALERMGAYGDFAGGRLGDMLSASTSRAETAAKIREALN
tara:strand:- start:624 stop:1049 length:426 start_codon:yes stop_codon:yes gene_type:complete